MNPLKNETACFLADLAVSFQRLDRACGVFAVIMIALHQFAVNYLIHFQRGKQ